MAWSASIGSGAVERVLVAPGVAPRLRIRSKKSLDGMKFSYRQILASAVGAVLSAVVASIFGVKGTIVGVAIGSIAATTGTALVFQSIERTNKAVKQVVVRAPETSLLRRLGGTTTAGLSESTPAEPSAPAEQTATSAAAAPDGATAGEATDLAVTQQMAAPTEPPEPPAPPDSADAAGADDARPGGIRWPVVALAVLGVFLFSLLFVTVVELIAGRPLADLFGHGGGGTTVERVFENSPTTTLPPPTTTTTSTTTSTSTTSTSTSTTTPGSSTTTSVGGSTTSTTGVGATSTTTPSTTTSTTTVSGTTAR